MADDRLRFVARLLDGEKWPRSACTVLMAGHTRAGHLRKINLSQVFSGQPGGVRQVSERIWLVTFMEYDLEIF